MTVETGLKWGQLAEARGNRLSENEAKNVMGPNDITVLFTNPQHAYYFAITTTILIKKAGNAYVFSNRVCPQVQRGNKTLNIL